MIVEKEEKSKDKIDLLLEWEEASEPGKKEQGDHIDISSEINGEEISRSSVKVVTEEVEEKKEPEDDSVENVVLENYEVSESIEEETPDEFTWSEELDNAIEDALDQANNIEIPIVHGQLNNIMRALETDSISKEQASVLLDEVEGYLERHLKSRETKKPVNNKAFENAMLKIIDGLQAYKESADLMRKYLQDSNPDTLMMSQTFADQGTEFIMTATDMMLEIEEGIS